jgi:Zinc finger, C3HC4 type (RING finger)
LNDGLESHEVSRIFVDLSNDENVKDDSDTVEISNIPSSELMPTTTPDLESNISTSVGQTQENTRIFIAASEDYGSKEGNCCLCDEKENLFLPCGHRMCILCLIKLRKSRIQFLCPLCRGTLDKAYITDAIDDYNKMHNELLTPICDNLQK